MESNRIRPLRHYWSNYWSMLLDLVSAPNPLMTMDTPLPRAFFEARMVCGWTSLMLCAGVLVRNPYGLVHGLTTITTSPSIQVTLGICVWLVASFLGAIILYALIRIYTLVSHVMISNVFKVRGQRLRMLNVQTALMPLTAPIALGIACSNVIPWLGWTLILASTVYGGTWLSMAHNVIFHKSRMGGVGLFLGGLFLTAFVFCVGAIAIAVGFGVIGFLIAALVRPIHHG